MGEARDTTKYRVVKNRKTVHVGITSNPGRREKEHQREYGGTARLVKEGPENNPQGCARVGTQTT